MIVRSYIAAPNQPFDFFNDAKDTIAWLRGMGYVVLAKHLSDRYDTYIAEYNLRLKKDREKQNDQAHWEYGKIEIDP